MERSRGILTRLTKLTDTSFIVHWFTEGEGLIKTAAKGARNPKSPFAGKLDLFYETEFEWVRSRKSDLHVLREVSVIATRESIRRNYNAMLLSGYCCRLLELLVERDHPEPELFDLLRRALNHTAEKGASARALRHFEHETARILGLSNNRRQAAPVLREHLGCLPPQRGQLLERLGNAADFHFPDGKTGDLT